MKSILCIVFVLLVLGQFSMAEETITVTTVCGPRADGGELLVSVLLEGFPPDVGVDVYLVPGDRLLWMNLKPGVTGQDAFFVNTPDDPDEGENSLLPGTYYLVARQPDILNNPFGAFEVPATCPLPFSFFEIKSARIKLGQDPNQFETDFKFAGRFNLGDSTNGIDPTTEGSQVELARFREYFKPGSFVKVGKKYFLDVGPEGDWNIKIKIDPKKGRFSFKAKNRGIDQYQPSDLPVRVSLQLGDDRGQEMIIFDPTGRYKAPK